MDDEARAPSDAPSGDGRALSELIRRRRRLLMPLAVVSAVWIGGLLVTAGFTRSVMAAPVLGPIPFGWLYAISIIPLVLVVAFVNSRVSSQVLEPLRREALDQAAHGANVDRSTTGAA